MFDSHRVLSSTLATVVLKRFETSHDASRNFRQIQPRKATSVSSIQYNLSKDAVRQTINEDQHRRIESPDTACAYPFRGMNQIMTVIVSVFMVDAESWRKRSLVSVEPRGWVDLMASCMHIGIRAGVGVWFRDTLEGYCVNYPG